ncbi:MAG: DUF5719 family protein [Actinomycetaceae bacterium]|nr:DUF5719 family protein [Actinomycetaceae bacterium]
MFLSKQGKSHSHDEKGDNLEAKAQNLEETGQLQDGVGNEDASSGSSQTMPADPAAVSGKSGKGKEWRSEQSEPRKDNMEGSDRGQKTFAFWKVLLTSFASVVVFIVLALAFYVEPKIPVDDALGQEITPHVQLPETTYPYVCIPTLAADEGVNPGVVKIQADESSTLVESRELTETGSNTFESTVKNGVIEAKSKSPLSFTFLTSSSSLIDGLSINATDTDTLTGISIASCRLPSTHAWFVSGSTQVESSSVLVVANPGVNAIEVHLQAWGATGKLDSEPDVTVPAQSSKLINLAAYFPQQERLALHAFSTGGTAVFNLHVSSLEGLSARGFARVQGASEPTQRSIIPSVNPAAKDSTLRIANPGQKTAKVTVSLLTAKGQEPLPGAEDMTIDEGGVYDVSLSGMPDDVGAVVVQSDERILTAAFGYFPEPTEEQPNRASLSVWEPVQPSVETVALPAPALGTYKAQTQVLVANLEDQPVEVSLAGTNYTLEPLQSKRVPVTGENIQLTSTHPVVANVEVTYSKGSASHVVSYPMRPVSESVPITNVTLRR